MTIAERAEEYAWKEWPNPMFAIEWEDCKSDYINGATEQKAIDIDKAVDWLLKNGFVDMESTDCDIHFKSGYIHDFKKAMEE